MTSKEMKELAELLQSVPAIKALDVRDVRRLADLLRESPEIGSIEVKGWFGTGVVITRTSSMPAGAAGAMPIAFPASGSMPAGILPARPAELREPEPARPGTGPGGAALKDIKSPMVGTFYTAPEPGAEPYAKVGTRVTAGQTVCIIEAMKLLNEIDADVSGTITKILVENGQPVEFGQPLFVIG